MGFFISQLVPIQQTMISLYRTIKHRIKEIIIFVLIFTVIGHYLPDIYLRYFDNRDYYQVKDLKIIDTDIKRCDTVHIQFVRTATANNKCIHTN